MPENRPGPPGSSRRVAGLHRNIFFIGLTSFLTDTTTKMVYAVMPLFLLSLGATKTELSLIEGVAESTASVLKAVSGWWSDRIGRNKPFMLIGYAFTAVLSPLFALAGSPLQVLFIRFTERVGKGIRSAPRDSLIAGSAGENNRGKGFGLHKTLDNSGAIVGPLLAFGLLLLMPGDYRRVFALAAIPGILGLITLIAFVKEAKKSKKELLGKISWRDFPLKYYVFLGIVFVFTLGNSTDALLLVKATDVGIQSTYVPLLYLAFNAVSVLFSIPAGIISDRIGRSRLIIFGYLLYAVLYFGFGRTGSAGVIILLFAFYGLYSAATDGVQKALVADLIDPAHRGTGLGLYNSIIGITLLPASLIGGLLYDHVNNRAPFYFGAVMALIAAAGMLLFYLHNRRRSPANPRVY